MTDSSTPRSRVTPGFTRVRMAGESISVLLVLEDGQIAVGDCAAVQYSGAGGRDGVFLAETYLPVLDQHVRPWLEGREVEPLPRHGGGRLPDASATASPAHGAAVGPHAGAARRAGQGPPHAPLRSDLRGVRSAHLRRADPDLRADGRQSLRERRQDDPQAGRRAAARTDQQRAGEAGQRRPQAQGVHPLAGPAHRPTQAARTTTARCCTSTSMARSG